MEIGAFLLHIAHRFVDHPLIFSHSMTYAGCCKDTTPMGQLIDVNFLLILFQIENTSVTLNVKVFSEHGLGAVVLTMEPSRYEYCKGSERSDDLRQVLEAGPGLLTRQAMLRTPFIWIQVRPPPWYSSRNLKDRIRRRIQSARAKLFRPRFSAECHRWLNEPLPTHRQRLARKLTIPFDHQMNVCFVVNLGMFRSGCFV